MRISDWSSDVCSSDLVRAIGGRGAVNLVHVRRRIDVESLIGHVSSPSCARQLPTPYPSWDRDRRSSGFRCRCTAPPSPGAGAAPCRRSEEHTSELQSLMRISYAVFCLKKKNNKQHMTNIHNYIADSYNKIYEHRQSK